MIKQFFKPTLGKIIFTFFSVIFIWSQGINFLELIYSIILSYLFWSLIIFIYMRLRINDYVNNANNFVPILLFIFSIAFFIIQKMIDNKSAKILGSYLLANSIGTYIGGKILGSYNPRIIFVLSAFLIFLFIYILKTSEEISIYLIGFILGLPVGSGLKRMAEKN